MTAFQRRGKMTKDDIMCYRVNYRKSDWEKYSGGNDFISVPLGIFDAIRALLDEIERLNGWKKTK